MAAGASTADWLVIRPLDATDTTAAAGTFVAALNGLRHSLNLPVLAASREMNLAAERVAHLVATDPDGSWCATSEGELVGFAQAARRGRLWVLAHLFVDPSAQSAGIGRRLLDASHRYGEGTDAGIIGSTPDPRAIGRYAALPGFAIHPTVTATGRLRRPVVPDQAVRPGSLADLGLAATVDIERRGGGHGPDLAHLISQGARLLVIDQRGYAVVEHASVSLLAASDEAAAAGLLRTALVVAADGAGTGEVTVGRMTSNQQWAVRVVSDAGLAFRPWGPIVIRGMDLPPAPYIPHPALC